MFQETQELYHFTFSAGLQHALAKLNFTYNHNNEQKECLKIICNGQSLFAVLPTGYGKSDIFALPPLILDQVGYGLFMT